MTMAGPKANMYTPETIEIGLLALAVRNGNSRAAARDLAEEGVEVPYMTLYRWMQETHRDRYLELREQVLPYLKAEMAGKLERITSKGADVLDELLDKQRSVIRDLDPRDVANAVKSVGTATGFASKNAAELRGDATVVEHRSDVEATLAGLRRLGLVPIESTATEIQDARLTE